MANEILADVQGVLKRLIYERGLINPADVAVAFEVPIRSWVAARTGPTVDLYLYDIRENTELRRSSLETTRLNGRGQMRVPPRRFDLCYLVSVLSTEIEDEHQVLWRLLLTLLKHPTLPAELLPESLRKDDLPIPTRLELPDGAPKPLEIWSALEMPPRPALGLVVTVPADLGIAFDAPLVLTRSARYRRIEGGAEPEDRRHHIGGVVKGRGDRPLAGATVSVAGSTITSTTNADGVFTFWGLPDGTVTIHVAHENQSKTVTFPLPSESYQVILE